MRGASAESLEVLVGGLTAAIDKGGDGNRIADDLFADDLFAVSELLATQPTLRRVLTDLSRPAEDKAGLVRQMFAGQLDDTSTELLAWAVSRRWAATWDLVHALEHLGVVAVVMAADRAGEADRLEEELFAFGQLVNGNPDLRDALSDPARASSDKQELLRGLLEGKVTAGTLRLAQQSTRGSHRTVTVAIDEYQKVAARHRQRLVALVTVARPLDDGQAQRLADVLSRQYGRPVHLNTLVDPDVIGGIRVEIGDEVIDGTVASRLDDARRRLAG
jgi:F-type H+-transporting ATPase subunit delta